MASGTYKPGSNQSDSFYLIDGVSLLGGYPNGGGTRDPILNETFLSGDIDNDDDLERDCPAYDSENSLHVVTAEDILDEDTLLDGFIIMQGVADGGSNDSSGGGMIVYETIPEFGNETTLMDSFCSIWKAIRARPLAAVFAMACWTAMRTASSMHMTSGIT